MSVKLAGGISNTLANVNINNELEVALSKDFVSAGHALGGAEINPDGLGVGREVRPMDISTDYRLRVGVDSILFSDTYNHGIVNISKYKVVNTIATNALTGGRWVLNNGNSVTSGQGTQIQTWSYYRFALSGITYIDFELQFAQVPQTNNVCEFGLGLASGVTAPTDGILFRLNASGIMQGVINNGGSETTVVLTGFSPDPATMYHFLISIHNDRTEFWIDDVLYGAIDTPKSIGSPCLSMSLPLFMRTYNSGVVTTAQRLEVSNVSITSGDQNINKLWATNMVIQGNSSINVPDGIATGQTANYVNSTIPTSATLSNTTAGYTTLGGQWQFASVAGAETDYALFAYLNPAGTNVLQGKNLIIRGIRIETFNMGAVSATTPNLLQFTVGVGSTGVSLATVDSATAGTCAPRRVSIGTQYLPVGAVIGQNCTPIDINFDVPLVVEPSKYFHLILKMVVGTATASQLIRGICFVNGYFE